MCRRLGGEFTISGCQGAEGQALLRVRRGEQESRGGGGAGGGGGRGRAGGGEMDQDAREVSPDGNLGKKVPAECTKYKTALISFK